MCTPCSRPWDACGYAACCITVGPADLPCHTTSPPNRCRFNASGSSPTHPNPSRVFRNDCAVCAHDVTHPKPPPPLRPEPMPPPPRRPRVLDTSRPFCPQAGCDYRGGLGLGNRRANGQPSGGPWRQWYGRSCQGYFLESHGPICHGKRISVERSVRVLACWAEGLGRRATAGGARATPLPSCPGWGKQLSRSGPFQPLCSATYTSTSGNSRRCTRCCAACKRGAQRRQRHPAP